MKKEQIFKKADEILAEATLSKQEQHNAVSKLSFMTTMEMGEEDPFTANDYLDMVYDGGISMGLKDDKLAKEIALMKHSLKVLNML